MTNSLLPLTETTLSLALAYVLHSIVLLIGVAVALRVLRTDSHTLRERLWKLAVVVPLVTAPAQVWSGAAPIPEGWQFAVATTESVPLETQTADISAATRDEMTKVDMPGEGASQTSVPSPLGGEGGRRPDEEREQTSLGHPSALSTTPSPALRAPSPPGGERTGLSSLPIANPVSEIGTATGTGELSKAAPKLDRPPFASLESATADETASSLTETEGPLVSPEANLAPAEPRPITTAAPPRPGQVDWPPPTPAKPPRSEIAVIGAATVSASREVPHANPGTLQTETITTVNAAAFGIAVAILASVLGGLLLLVVQRVRFWIRLRKCTMVEDGVTRRELDLLLKRKGISRRVRLLVSDGFAEPVACGVLRWTIIVPHGVENRLNQEQIECLLAHELGHLVRGDTAWLWIGNIVCSCLWFQPLNFLARRRWQQAAEFLSDEWAIADANVCPISLAQCLTQIAEWRLDRQESGAILAAGGHRSTLSSRIDCLVQDKRPADAWKSRQRKRAVLLGVLAVGGSLVWAVPGAEFVRADAPRASEKAFDGKTGNDPVATAEASAGNLVKEDPPGDFKEKVTATGEAAPRPSTLDNARLTESSETNSWRAEWNELQAELKGLNADLIRVAELLEKYPGNQAVREMASQVRARAASFEARRRDLDARLKAEQKQAATRETPSPFYLEDDVEYFAPGPEFRLPGDEE